MCSCFGYAVGLLMLCSVAFLRDPPPFHSPSQCYDNFLLEQLRFAAQERGQYQWGTSGPHDAGSYNDWPQATGFFCNQGSFATDYGRFFLEWYSGTLLQHGDRVLEAAADAFAGLPTKLAAKVGLLSGR